MLFEQPHGDEAVFDYLETHTLNFNGFTTTDATVFTELRAPASELENLLALETARVEEPCDASPEASFVRQREIVRNEIRQHEDEGGVQTALASASLFGPKPRFARSATVDSIAAITHEDACVLMRDNYAPSDAVIVLSGRSRPMRQGQR